MIRYISFRAKATHTGKWVYGYPLHRNGKYMLTSYGLGYYDGSWCVRINPKTLSESSGTFDVKNEEIFEGDILTTPDHSFLLLAYNNSEFRFELLDENIHTVCQYSREWCMANKARVIGNRWDNSDMLEAVISKLQYPEALWLEHYEGFQK